MEGLGAYIRQLRDKKDLSLREFAKRLKLSAAFVSDVELGRRHPSDDVLPGIARLLGTTVGDLREHDIRPPIDEIKRATEDDPKFALAFRTVLDRKISADDLLALLNSKQPKKASSKK